MKWLKILAIAFVIGLFLYTIFSGESSNESITISPIGFLFIVLLLIAFLLVYFFVIKRRRFQFPGVSVSRFHWRWVKPLLALSITLLVLVVTYRIFTLDYDKIITEMFRDDDDATEQPYSAFAGLATYDFGPMKIKDGESFKIQALLGQAYWPHPKQAGTYIITIVDMNDVVLCKTKVVKEPGKDTQFLPLIPAPGEVEIKMYKITFDRGGDFIVSPNMVL